MCPGPAAFLSMTCGIDVVERANPESISLVRVAGTDAILSMEVSAPLQHGLPGSAIAITASAWPWALP